MLITILIITISYLLGSISSAILLCKIFYFIDPRNYESKNPGATNVFRIVGYKLAIGVVLFDFLKGAASVWLGYYFEISSYYLQVVIIAVCIGHIYPIFFQFSGGKGVATVFGALTAISVNFFVIMISIWLLIVLFFRYISLGSIVTSIIMPVYVWCVNPQYFVLVTLLSTLILFKHNSNIKRLWCHQEKQIWNR